MQAEEGFVYYTSTLKLEKQTRIVTDSELIAISKIFNVLLYNSYNFYKL